MGKISLEAIGRAQISLDTFRKQVNVVNPKNKGYVRFTRGKDQSITLEKINNFCDLFSVNLRTNIDPQRNQAMRQAMLNAIQGDLTYVSKDLRERILAAIAKCDTASLTADPLKQVMSADAMKRTELKAIFELFDSAYNNVVERRSIVGRLVLDKLGDAVPHTGNEAVDRKTALDYLENVLKIDIDRMFTIADEQNPDGRSAFLNEDGTRTPSVRESEFRAMLFTLGKAIDQARKTRSLNESFLACLAQNLLAKGDATDYVQSSKLIDAPELRGAWRNAFEGLLADGCRLLAPEQQAALKRGVSNNIGSPLYLDIYIDHVLGHRLNHVVAQLANLEELRKISDPKLLMIELGRQFDLAKIVIDDAVDFATQMGQAVNEMLSAEAKLDSKGAVVNEKTKWLLISGRDQKEYAEQLMKLMKSDFDVPLKDLAKIRRWVGKENIANFLHAYTVMFADDYSARNFGASRIADFDRALAEVIERRGQQLTEAAKLEYKGGGLKDQVSELMKHVDQGIDNLVARGKIDAKSPNLRRAYELVYTHALQGLLKREGIEDLLADGDGGFKGRGMLLLSNLTALVTRRLDSADRGIRKASLRYGAELERLVKAGELDGKRASRLLRSYGERADAAVEEAVVRFLGEVAIDMTKSLEYYNKQGSDQDLLDRLIDLVGLGDSEEDEETGRLDAMLRGALESAKDAAECDIIEARIGNAQGAINVKVGRGTLAKDAGLKFECKELPTLCAGDESQAAMFDALMGGDARRIYAKTMRPELRKMLKKEREGFRRVLDKTALEAAAAKFEAALAGRAKEVNAFMDKALAVIRERGVKAQQQWIRQNHPNADAREVERLAKLVVEDALAACLGGLRKEFLAVLTQGGTLPDPDEFSLRVGKMLMSAAEAAGVNRAQKIVDAITNDAEFTTRNVKAAGEALVKAGKLPEAYIKDSELKKGLEAVLTGRVEALKAKVLNFPAVWSAKGIEGLDQLFVAALVDEGPAALVERFTVVRGRIDALRRRDEELRNSLPSEQFAKICDEALFGTLAKEGELDRITEDSALAEIEKAVKAKVNDIALMLQVRAMSRMREYDTNAELWDGTVMGRIKRLVDAMLHGQFGEVDENLPERFAERCPTFGKMAAGPVWRRLAGEAQLESNGNSGTLRAKITASFVNLVYNDYLEAERVYLAKVAEAEAKHEPAPLVNTEPTLEASLKKLELDVLLRKVEPIAEGFAVHADEILRETVSEDAIIAGLAEEAEQRTVDENFTAEDKARLTADLRAAAEELRAEREGGVRSENGVLATLRAEIGEYRMEAANRGVFDDAVAAATAFAFDEWAGVPSYDAQGKLTEAAQKVRDAVDAYRKGVSARLIDSWRTRQNLDLMKVDVEDAIGYLEIQLNQLNLHSTVKAEVSEAVRAELTATGGKIAETVGAELNRRMAGCLDGVVKFGDLREKIDNIVWQVAQERIAARFRNFYTTYLREIFGKLFLQEGEESVYGTTKELSSGLATALMTYDVDRIDLVKAEIGRIVAKCLGLTDDTLTFADRTETLKLLCAAPETIVQRAVGELQMFAKRVKLEHNADVDYLAMIHAEIENGLDDLLNATLMDGFKSATYKGQTDERFAEWYRRLGVRFNLSEDYGNRFNAFIEALRAQYGKTAEKKSEGVDFAGYADTFAGIARFFNVLEQSIEGHLLKKWKGVQQETVSEGVTFMQGTVEAAEVKQFVNNTLLFVRGGVAKEELEQIDCCRNLAPTAYETVMKGEHGHTYAGFVKEINRRREAMFKALVDEVARKQREAAKMMKSME